jgi:hypothetical protein
VSSFFTGFSRGQTSPWRLSGNKKYSNNIINIYLSTNLSSELLLQMTTDILQLWSSGKRGEAIENLRPFPLKDGYQKGEIFITTLLSALDTGAHDFILAVNEFTINEFKTNGHGTYSGVSLVYERMLRRAGLLGDVEKIEKIIKIIEMDKLGANCNKVVLKNTILMFLQEGKHYGKFGLPTLREIINGDQMGDIDMPDFYLNNYCERVRGVIAFENISVWKSLDKSKWTNRLYNEFYRNACLVNNLDVINDIQKTEDVGLIIIYREYKMFKCVYFKDLDNLQILIGKIPIISELISYLFNIICSYPQDNCELIDLFIKNFGLNMFKEKISLEISTHQKTFDRNCLVHLVEHGLLLDEKLSSNFCSYFFKNIVSNNQVVQDTCFLVERGLTNINYLKSLDIGYCLVDIYLRLIIGGIEKKKVNRLFEDEEVVKMENLLNGLKFELREYLLSDLAFITEGGASLPPYPPPGLFFDYCFIFTFQKYIYLILTVCVL